MGPERLRVALQLALLGRAPADARGCTRLSGGIKQGSRQLMRWFPPVRFRTPALFLLDPFEWPVVPRPGIYAVVYLDGRLVPLGGPRFTSTIGEGDAGRCGPQLALSRAGRLNAGHGNPQAALSATLANLYPRLAAGRETAFLLFFLAIQLSSFPAPIASHTGRFVHPPSMTYAHGDCTRSICRAGLYFGNSQERPLNASEAAPGFPSRASPPS